MKRVGFTMKLKPGKADEYRRRHDEIWPELAEQLKAAGVSDYVIYLDPRSLVLFASQKITDDNTADRLPENPIVRKWWAYMSDLMETNPDQSPQVLDLTEMFYME